MEGGIQGRDLNQSKKMKFELVEIKRMYAELTLKNTTLKNLIEKRIARRKARSYRQHTANKIFGNPRENHSIQEIRDI